MMRAPGQLHTGAKDICMGLERHSFHDKRVDDRVAVFHRTRAIGPDGQPLALVVVDLSLSGMMARCDISFLPGVEVDVKLPVIGDRPARVRWSLGGRIGFAFCTPLSQGDFETLLAALRQIG